MKKLMNRAFGVFFMTLIASAPLHGLKAGAKKVEAPIERVVKGVSVLDQIMEQAKLIVEFEDSKALAQAKKQLASLMNNKKLHPKIKEVITDDIEIIKKTTESTQKASQAAYDRLKVVAKQVEAQANVVVAIEEGAAIVKNAPIDEKQQAIKEAQEKIEEAQEEQGMLWRLYAGARRMITAPVNYVFGEESSKAKTAFYATVGAAVLAGGAYGASRYGDELEKVEKNKSDLGKKRLLEELKQEALNLEINDFNVKIMRTQEIKSEEEQKQAVAMLEKESEQWRSKIESLIQQGKISTEDIDNIQDELNVNDILREKYQELSAVERKKENRENAKINTLVEEGLVTGGEMNEMSEFKEFIQKFAPPLNIQETIESHKDIDFGFIKGKDEYSNVFAKGYNYSRLFNSERMRNCIESNKFSTLEVPKKWIYKVNGKWRVYAEYIPSEEVQKITKEEIKELVELAEQTGFRDWARQAPGYRMEIILYPNIIIDQRNGKITIVDTEDRSFRSEGVLFGKYGWAPKDCKLQYIKSLETIHDRMDWDARLWFDRYLYSLLNSGEGITPNEPLPLPWSGQFDDPNFDFEKIKEELRKDTN